MSNDIIRYTIEQINTIESKIDTILDDEIIQKLLEIKKNNRFLKKTTPVRLKYSMITETANKWKEAKLDKTREEEHFKESINLNLNKVSIKFYDSIVEKILTSIHEYGLDKSKDIILDLIFSKSINEKQYANLYCKLCIRLIEVYGSEFKTKILEQSETFYNDNIKEICEGAIHISYDKFCDNNKLKKKLIGIYIFMSYLYTNNIISTDIILKYINSLFHTIYNRDDHETDLQCLCELITIVGKKLEQDLKHKQEDDNFRTKIIKRLGDIKNDRKTFKPKLRFLVMNVLDLHKKKWTGK